MKDHDHCQNENGTPAVTSAREHQQVWESLPWVIQGSADADQLRRATAHLAECADCRQELQAQQRLRQAIAEAAPPFAADAEAGLRCLLERLDAPVVEQPLPSPALARPPRREANRLTLALAAAVVVQAIGLGALGLQVARDDNTTDYRMLSQPPASAQQSARLQVIPAASMTMADWQRLLEAHGLRVVDGPNAVGSYALAFIHPAATQPSEALLTALRATPGVRLAEPIAPVR